MRVYYEGVVDETSTELVECQSIDMTLQLGSAQDVLTFVVDDPEGTKAATWLERVGLIVRATNAGGGVTLGYFRVWNVRFRPPTLEVECVGLKQDLASAEISDLLGSWAEGYVDVASNQNLEQDSGATNALGDYIEVDTSQGKMRTISTPSILFSAPGIGVRIVDTLADPAFIQPPDILNSRLGHYSGQFSTTQHWEQWVRVGPQLAAGATINAVRVKYILNVDDVSYNTDAWDDDEYNDDPITLVFRVENATHPLPFGALNDYEDAARTWRAAVEYTFPSASDYNAEHLITTTIADSDESTHQFLGQIFGDGVEVPGLVTHLQAVLDTAGWDKAGEFVIAAWFDAGQDNGDPLRLYTYGRVQFIIDFTPSSSSGYYTYCTYDNVNEYVNNPVELTRAGMGIEDTGVEVGNICRVLKPFDDTLARWGAHFADLVIDIDDIPDVPFPLPSSSQYTSATEALDGMTETAVTADYAYSMAVDLVRGYLGTVNGVTGAGLCTDVSSWGGGSSGNTYATLYAEAYGRRRPIYCEFSGSKAATNAVTQVLASWASGKFCSCWVRIDQTDPDQDGVPFILVFSYEDESTDTGYYIVRFAGDDSSEVTCELIHEGFSQGVSNANITWATDAWIYVEVDDTNGLRINGETVYGSVKDVVWPYTNETNAAGFTISAGTEPTTADAQTWDWTVWLHAVDGHSSGRRNFVPTPHRWWVDSSAHLQFTNVYPVATGGAYGNIDIDESTVVQGTITIEKAVDQWASKVITEGQGGCVGEATAVGIGPVRVMRFICPWLTTNQQCEEFSKARIYDYNYQNWSVTCQLDPGIGYFVYPGATVGINYAGIVTERPLQIQRVQWHAEHDTEAGTVLKIKAGRANSESKLETFAARVKTLGQDVHALKRQKTRETAITSTTSSIGEQSGLQVRGNLDVWGNLVVNGTLPNRPAFCAASEDNSYYLTNGWTTTVKFEIERFDTDGCYDTSTSKFTPNVAGWYLCGGSILTTNEAWTTAHTIAIGVAKNGTRQFVSNRMEPHYATTQQWMSDCVGWVYCNGTTDYLTLQFYQDKGTNDVTVYTADVYNQFWAVRLF